MAIISEKRFFHFARDAKAESFMDLLKVREWKDDAPNRRTMEKGIDYSPKLPDLINGNGKQVGVLQYIEDYLTLYDKKQTNVSIRDVLNNAWIAGYDMNQRFWETLFEKIRKDHYDELPSRYGCLYVADKENLIKWHSKLVEDGFHNAVFYELELTGKVHYTHGGWLELDVVSENEIIGNAHKYWKGKEFKDESVLGEEILFCGTSRFIRKFKSIKEL